MHVFLKGGKKSFFPNISLQGRKTSTGCFTWGTTSPGNPSPRDITWIKGSAEKELLSDILQENLSGVTDRKSGEGWEACCGGPLVRWEV